jgi:transposase
MTRRPKKTRRARRPRKPRQTARPTKRRDPLDDFIAAGARSLDLKIEPEWQAAVRTHLRVTLQHGAKVADFALPDDAEPAPVFEA